MTGPDMTGGTPGDAMDAERPGVAAILDAWQGVTAGTRPVLSRFALGTALGGPLDLVAGYPLGDRWLAVTLGLTDLDGTRSADPAISGTGFEFTMRVRRPVPAAAPPPWMVRLLAALAARMRDGADFGPGDWILTAGPLGGEPGNAPLTALAIDYDPVLRRIGTPHGTVDFLTVVGLTTAEGAAAQRAGSVRSILDDIRAGDPALTTDPARPAVR